MLLRFALVPGGRPTLGHDAARFRPTADQLASAEPRPTRTARAGTVGVVATTARTPIRARTVRMLMPVAALLFLGLALLIRAVDDGTLRQYSGTALYASMVWAMVLFLWPRMAPVPAGIAAIAFCWVVELAQLTGVPAELSVRSVAARLALGVQFDPVDLAWYPAGVVPLTVLHHLVRARHRRSHPATDPIRSPDARSAA